MEVVLDRNTVSYADDILAAWLTWVNVTDGI